MATYRIEWKPSAFRELRRLDRQIIPRVIKPIEALAINPFPSGVRKLHGGEMIYRLRVGDYRVVYEVYSDHLLIEIARVRHRRDAYRT